MLKTYTFLDVIRTYFSEVCYSCCVDNP